MERHVLSKSTFIRGVQCYKSLYLNKKYPFLRDKFPDSKRAVFKRGSDVGLLAQQLFPKGVDLKPKSASQFSKKVQETGKIIRTNSFYTLYEASFQFEKSLAILDVLSKGKQSWIAYEVKSSVNISETYLLDAAFQYYVITNSGVELEDFFLIYINKDYVLEGELELDKLFIKQSVLKEVVERQEFISEQIKEEKQILHESSVPEVNIGVQCYDPYPCDFISHCWQSIKENSVLYLDAFEEKERLEAYYLGKDDPGKFQIEPKSEIQRIQLLSAKNKEIFVDKEKLFKINENIEDAIIFSPHFIKPAIPYVTGTRPYQPIPVSCGIQASHGNLEIYDFIQRETPFDLFVLYFRKVLSSSLKIMIYDCKELLDFLKETGCAELLEETKERCIDLSQIFKTGAIFDYRLKGDYTPQNIARIILKKRHPQLDPSLLNMNWQITLLKSDIDKKLLEDTHKYIHYITDFQRDLMSLIKNPKSGILLLNK